jgi:hypothetical protein
MNLDFRNRVLRAAATGVFAVGLLPSFASAAPIGTSTGTLVGAVTCGADATTPAANAVVSVAGLNGETRTDSSGRFALTDVPAGQSVRVDAATDPQQSSMSSRFNVVTDSGQTLDIGSLDIGVCPTLSAQPSAPSDWEVEQRGNPND